MHQNYESRSQKIMSKCWKKAEERATALEKQYLWYTPLYTHPSPSLIELRAKVEALPMCGEKDELLSADEVRADILDLIDKMGGGV